MARKKVREYTGKLLIYRHIQKFNRLLNYSNQILFLVTNETNFRKLWQDNAHVIKENLVAKPDMLFGKRGKHNLVLLNKSVEEVEKFILERLGQPATIGGVTGKLTHFLIEKFLPHKEEYYLAITSARNGNEIKFSVEGGIEVEENWSKVKEIIVPIDVDISETNLDDLLVDVPQERKDMTKQFIHAVYQVFVDLDFTLLEFNPFTFDQDGIPVPLDMHAELDDTSFFKNRKKWLEIEFPQPFGRSESPEEKFVEYLDSKTGASLKLTVLNPHGLIWNMTAGGGASVVYADAIVDCGYGAIMGNYGEYSGNPTEEETYQYAKTIIKLATKYPDDGKKALIIGGGIANFTDVAKTFKGITHAIEECQEDLKFGKVKIFVRRGGPNYKSGLEMMRSLGTRLALDIEVYGPEMGMTDVVPLAVTYIQS